LLSSSDATCAGFDMVCVELFKEGLLSEVRIASSLDFDEEQDAR